MVIFILSIVTLIIGKFIYDSYFSDNTDKNWEKFKKANPHRAAVIDNSKGFNMNPIAKIRTDGYYIGKHSGRNFNGDSYTVNILFFFNKNGIVEYEDTNDLLNWEKENSDEILKEYIIDFNEINEIDLSPRATHYEINKGGILMKFYDPEDYSNINAEEPQVYDEWSGSVIHNGLILSFERSNFNVAYKGYTKQSILKDLKFDFVSINFN